MKELVNRPFAHFEPTELNDGYPSDDEPVTSGDLADEADDMVENAEVNALNIAVLVADEPHEIATEATPCDSPSSPEIEELDEEQLYIVLKYTQKFAHHFKTNSHKVDLNMLKKNMGWEYISTLYFKDLENVWE